MNNLSESKKIDTVPWGHMLFSIFSFSLIVRLIIGMAYSNSYDTEWNIMWGVELGDGFFSAYSHLTNLDYPPLYLYPLYIVGRLVEIEAIGGYQPFRMLAIKFVPCLMDSLTCLIFYKLGARRSKALGLFVAGIWALNPASIFNCAFWGQTDCVMMCLAALLFVALGQKRLILSGILYAVLCSTKLQGLYLTPIVGMELLTICFGDLNVRRFQRSNINIRNIVKFFKFAGAAIITAAAAFVPFMIGAGSVWLPLSVYTGGVDKYQYCTMNADNLYMLLGLNGAKDDLELFLGMSFYSFTNIILVLSMCMVAVVYLFGRRKSHWLAAYMLMECIFMLTSRQHERYQIMVLVMLLGAFIEIADKRVLTLFYLHAFVIFANQSRVLGVVHERKVAEWCNYSYILSGINSFLNVILFVASMVFVFKFYFGKPRRKMAVNQTSEIRAVTADVQ